MPVLPPGAWLNPDSRPPWCEVTAAGRFAVPRDGGRFDRHHHDDHELWFIAEGKAKVLTDGAEHYVQAGDIVLTQAGDTHDVVEVYEDLRGFFVETGHPGGWTGGAPSRVRRRGRGARRARARRAGRLPGALTVRVAVTGSSGKLGSATVERLRADGHEVVGFDRDGMPGAGFVRVDLTDYGQVLDSLLGVTARHDGLDAVVHLAAIPVNGLVPDAATFHNNVTVTFNVLHAALRAGIRTVVMASSITAMGFPFDEPPPYLPVDEDVDAGQQHLRARQGRRGGDGGAAGPLVPRPGDHRTAVHQRGGPGRVRHVRAGGDPAYRRSLLFSYVDARDGAAAVALSLDRPEPGLRVLSIAAPDTGSASRPPSWWRRTSPTCPCTGRSASSRRSSRSTAHGSRSGTRRRTSGATSASVPGRLDCESSYLTGGPP